MSELNSDLCTEVSLTQHSQVNQLSIFYNIREHGERIDPHEKGRNTAYRLVWSALPAFIRKGTPSHLALLIKTAAAANVGVRLSFGTVG